MNWKIRFYSGLNQGIDVPLEHGCIVLGSDPQVADLVLIDEGIAAAHVTLDVSEEGVQLTAFAEDVEPQQNGAPLTMGSSLRPLACQEAGPLIWAFCSSDQSFPAQLEQKSAVMPVTVVQNKPKFIGYFMAGFSLLLMIMLTALLSESLWSGDADAAAGSPDEIIANFLKTQSFDQVRIGAQSDSGELILTGYLSDDNSLALLQRFLEREKLRFRLDIRTQEEIKQQIDFIIQKFGYDQVTSTSSDKVGWVRLSGQVNKEDYHWRQMEALLKRDVPGLLGIEDKVNVTGDYLVRLEQLLSNYSLKERLSYRESGDRIEFSGQLSEAETHRFTLLQNEFNRDFGGSHVLALVAPVKKKTLAFSVRAISLGKVPYVVLSDNRKYPVGATTPHGVRIIEIHSDRIVLNKDKQQYIVNIKGNEWHDDRYRGAAG